MVQNDKARDATPDNATIESTLFTLFTATESCVGKKASPRCAATTFCPRIVPRGDIR